MRVAWQFSGYSRLYQQFLGWAEVILALLLPRHTATLGALLSIVVLANMFAISPFFDVCVKLNSGLYLAGAVLIFLQDTGRLWHFFIQNRPLLPRAVATNWFSYAPRPAHLPRPDRGAGGGLAGAGRAGGGRGAHVCAVPGHYPAHRRVAAAPSRVLAGRPLAAAGARRFGLPHPALPAGRAAYHPQPALS